MKKIVFALFIIFIFAMGVTGVLSIGQFQKQKVSAPMEREAQPKQATDRDIKKLSLQAAEILESLAATGGSAEAQKQLDELLKRTDQYDLHEDPKSNYIKKLAACLEALQSYAKGDAEEKALGHVYPGFLSAMNQLKKEMPDIQLSEPSQYQWFYAAAAAYEQGRKQEGMITLTMVGDTSFGTYPETPEHLKFDNVFAKNNGNNLYVFKNCLPWFNSDDFTIINAESAFTTLTKAENKKWRIKSDPAHAAFLPASGVEAANLANNHTKDYFEEGYKDTLSAFEANNTDVFDDGMPLVQTIGGIETIFLGYDCRMSQFSADYLARIERDVKQYKRPDNLVIVNMHLGVEYRETPVDYQKQFGRAIIDAGADIIMGSHPHRLESVELYDGKYIVYSMGDFAFGADPTLLSRMTSMFRLNFAKENGEVVMKGMTIVPTLENSDGSTTENNYQPLPVFGEEAENIVNDLIRISTPTENGVTAYDYFDPFL